jgi:23S rRNA (pseudouridine1915-N3)-methyltransferase
MEQSSEGRETDMPRAEGDGDANRRLVGVRYRLICLDRVRESYVAAAVDDFARRLRRYTPLEVVEVPAARGTDTRRAMGEESGAVLKRIEPGDVVWLLERTGEELTSVDLSERLATLAVEGVRRLVLVIAGAFGASDDLLARANFRWSLSQLTFLHEWTRAIVLEQLYRAAKIARNEPYHH